MEKSKKRKRKKTRRKHHFLPLFLREKKRVTHRDEEGRREREQKLQDYYSIQRISWKDRERKET